MALTLAKLSQWHLINPNCFDVLLIILKICVLKVKLKSNTIHRSVIFEINNSLKFEI